MNGSSIDDEIRVAHLANRVAGDLLREQASKIDQLTEKLEMEQTRLAYACFAMGAVLIMAFASALMG